MILSLYLYLSPPLSLPLSQVTRYLFLNIILFYWIGFIIGNRLDIEDMEKKIVCWTNIEYKLNLFIRIKSYNVNIK